MENCIDRVGLAPYVTKLDLLQVYWPFPSAWDTSAFVKLDNFLRYTVMTFGRLDEPATFQVLMLKVLFGGTNYEAYQ